MSIKVIKPKPEFVDERGFISRLVDNNNYPIKAILYIKSKAGSVRGNHYHNKDAHYIYCVSGKFRYFEKDMSKNKSKLKSVIIEPGDLVLSKPMVFHKMEFLEDTVFLAITTEPREQAKYEKDTIRIKK